MKFLGHVVNQKELLPSEAYGYFQVFSAHIMLFSERHRNCHAELVQWSMSAASPLVGCVSVLEISENSAIVVWNNMPSGRFLPPSNNTSS